MPLETECLQKFEADYQNCVRETNSDVKSRPVKIPQPQIICCRHFLTKHRNKYTELNEILIHIIYTMSCANVTSAHFTLPITTYRQYI